MYSYWHWRAASIHSVANTNALARGAYISDPKTWEDMIRAAHYVHDSELLMRLINPDVFRTVTPQNPKLLK